MNRVKLQRDETCENKQPQSPLKQGTCCHRTSWNSFCVVEVSDDSMFSSDLAFDGMFSALTGCLVFDVLQTSMQHCWI